MNHRKPLASMTARSAAIIGALTVMALAGALFAFYVHPAYAQEGSAPDKPTGLSATATHDQVVLTWDDPDDDTITGYAILRRLRENDTGGEFSELAPDTGSTATTYTDDSVAANTTYTYRIKAINEHGVSERSRWFHIDTPAAPIPAKPTGLSATASHDQVALTWDDPGDDTITGYAILRRNRDTDRKGQFRELVADTGIAAVTYTDDSVVAETNYTYRIKAINEHGVSERSRWFHIDTPAAPEAVEGDDRDEQDGEDDDGGAPGHATPPGPGGRANVSEGGTDLPSNGSTTGEVEVDGTVTGSIGSGSDDKDWFKVVLQEGVEYQFDLEGKSTSRGTADQPRLRITGSVDQISSDGGQSGEGLDKGVGENSRIIKSYSGSGTTTRFLRVTRKSGSDSGTYTLSVIRLDGGASEGKVGNPSDEDFDANASTKGKIVVGASATGYIHNTSGNKDAFSLELERGKRYQIDVEGSSTGRGSLADPRIRLLAPDYSTEVARDFSSGNARLTFLPSRPGRYFVEVRSGEKGSYTVSVREVGPPPHDGFSEGDTDLPDNADTTGVVEVDGVGARGAIHEPKAEIVTWTATDDEGREVVHESTVYEFDTDWFAVELEAGRTYRIDMKGAILDGYDHYDHGLTLRLPQINAIYDADGDYLLNTWGADESSAHHLFRVTFHAHAGGTYYIAASGESFEWGGYELRVIDVTEDAD